MAVLEVISQSGILTALLFFVVWAGIWVPVAVPVAIALHWYPPQPLSPTQKLPLVLTLYALAPLVLWGAIWFTGGSWHLYGWAFNTRMLRSCIVGIGVGAVSLLSVYAVQVRLGWLAWAPRPVNGPKDLMPPRRPILLPLTLTLGVALVVGAVEELVFRGFLFYHLQTDYGGIIAAIASSAIFAALHLIWEGRKGLWQLPGLWCMGIALVLACGVDQGQLGLAWGLHSGWVWVVASLDTLQWLQPSGKAPDWITGIAGHPLAGLAGVGFMLTMAIALYSLDRAGLGPMG